MDVDSMKLQFYMGLKLFTLPVGFILPGRLPLGFKRWTFDVKDNQQQNIKKLSKALKTKSE